MVERGKREGDAPTTAISRVEQLYPRAGRGAARPSWPASPTSRTVRWVQDEPANNGPAPHFRLNVFPELGPRGRDHLAADLELAGRRAPHSRHVEELKQLLAAGVRPSSAMYFTDRGVEELAHPAR